MKIFLSLLFGVISLPILDYIFVGTIMKNFYLDKMGFHLNIKDGAVSPNLLFAVLTYIVMSVMMYLFVVRYASDWKSVACAGALLGFLAYSFYDFTNLATMKNYPVILGMVDIAWGTTLMAFVSTVMFLIVS